MSNYTKSTNFTAKDALITGDPSKKVLGSELDTELTAVSAAVTTKLDTISSLSAETVADASADYLAIYDNSAATHKKILIPKLITTGTSSFLVVSSTAPVVTGFSGSNIYNSMKLFGNSAEAYDHGSKVSGWVLTPAAGGTTQYWRLRVFYVLTHGTAFVDGALTQVCITRFNSSDVAQSRYVVSQKELGIAINSLYGSGETIIPISTNTDYITVESLLSTATNYNMFQLEFSGERIS
jgi:hypothetical protein